MEVNRNHRWILKDLKDNELYDDPSIELHNCTNDSTAFYFMKPDQTSEPRSDRSVLIVILAVSFVIQTILAFIPDTMGDIVLFRMWLKKLITAGVQSAYLEQSSGDVFYYPINYPPVFPYILLALGKLIKIISPEQLNDQYFLSCVIKFPGILSNLGITALLYRLVDKEAPHQSGSAAAAFYALNPAVLFTTCYWGQMDSIALLFAFSGLLCLYKSRPALSGVFLALGILTKPLVLPLVLVVVVWKLRFRPAVYFISGLLLTSLLVMSPLLLAGGFDFITLLYQRLDVMPFVSVNAHNVWWLSTGGVPWIASSDLIFGSLTYKVFGFILVFLTFGVFGRAMFHREDFERIFLTASLFMFGFFMLSTQMHENHLIYGIPFLAIFGSRGGIYRKLFFAVSLTFFFNLLLHDPYINYRLNFLSFGKEVFLPPQNDVPAAVIALYQAEGKNYIMDEILGRFSFIRLSLTYFNSSANIFLFAVMVMICLKKGHKFTLKKSPALAALLLFLALLSLFWLQIKA